MVRSADTRSTKYDKKLDGAVWNARITAYKDTMVEQINNLYPTQQHIEELVKKHLENIGMYGIQQHHYLNYAYELWAKTRTYTQQTLKLEAEQTATKWQRRGLNPTILTNIARLFGIKL